MGADHGEGNTVWADRPEKVDFLRPAKGTLEAGVVHAACEVNPRSTVARTPSRSGPIE